MEEEAGIARANIQNLTEKVRTQQLEIQDKEEGIKTKIELIGVEHDAQVRLMEESKMKSELLRVERERVRSMEKSIREKENETRVQIQVIAAMDEEVSANHRAMKDKDDQIELKAQEILALRKEIKAKHDEVTAKNDEITVKNEEIGAKNEDIKAKDDTIKAKEIEIAAIAEQASSQVERKNQRIADLHKFIVEAEKRDLTRKSWKIPRVQIENIPKHEIGRGAWAMVYSGTFQGEHVAIKQPHRAILHHTTIELLKREVMLMSEIHYPNLLRFIGAVFDGAVERGVDMPIIVFELMDMNLREAYTNQDLSNSLISIFCDVAYALDYLHQCPQPIIHRDVSAPNVLLKTLQNGIYVAKVSDFGSANLAKQAQTAGAGAIVYSAPEMFPNEDITVPPQPQTTKVDVFSYGILLLEVKAKEMPKSGTRYTMLQKVKQQSKPIYELIVHCTKSLPSDRPTMADILNKLNSGIIQ